jgi:hypothetical protein
MVASPDRGKRAMRIMLAAATLTALLSAPASAVVLSGIHQQGDPDLSLLIGRVDTGPCFFVGCVSIGTGLYRVTYELSQPLVATLSLGGVDVFDEYDADGNYVGGDEHPYMYASITRQRALGQAILKVPRPFETPGFDGGTVFNYFLGATALDVVSPAQYSFSFSLDRIGDVPEPATWLQLLTGFGLVGGWLRWRRASIAQALPHAPWQG